MGFFYRLITFTLMTFLPSVINAQSSKPSQTTLTTMSKADYLRKIEVINQTNAADFTLNGSSPCLELVKVYQPKIASLKLYQRKESAASPLNSQNLELVTQLSLPSYAGFTAGELMQVSRVQSRCRFPVNRVWGDNSCPLCTGIERVAPFIRWGKRLKQGRRMAAELYYDRSSSLERELRESSREILVSWPKGSTVSLPSRLFAIFTGAVMLNRTFRPDKKITTATFIGEQGLGALLCRFQSLRHHLLQKSPQGHICGWETSRLDFYQSPSARFRCLPASEYKGRGATKRGTFLKDFDYPHCRK